MDTHLAKNVRRNSILVALVIAIALFGILAIIPSYSLKTISAIVTLTIALALPIHQKRFSPYSIFLVVSGILFLLSGVIDDAYRTVVSPLPVLKQIEFSKIMRPAQVSRGLLNLAFSILYVMISFAWLQANKISEKPKSRLMKFGLWVMVVFGVLFSVLGIASIVEGLSKL